MNAATMQDLKYTYDPVGNIVEIRDDAQQTVYFDNAVASPRQRYEYDAVYRLTKAEGRETPNGAPNHTELVPSASPPPNDPSAVVTYTEEYTYDEVGNIFKMKHTAAGNNWTRHYQYVDGSNRLDSTSLADDPPVGPYTYDAHGNMTAMPHLSDGLLWDQFDRLQKTDEGGGGVTYYVYDGAGQRVRKVHINLAGSTSKERLYFGAWETYRERHNINTTPVLDLERETLHLHDDAGRICTIETKTVEDDEPIADPVNIARYQYNNHLGSATLELDDSAALISYEEFHPYGTISYTASDGASGASRRRFQYTGRERDEETGLQYHESRYYAPWLGRWNSADPIGVKGGINIFAYCMCDPIGCKDQEGTSPDRANPQAAKSRSAGAQSQRMPSQIERETPSKYKETSPAARKALADLRYEPAPHDNENSKFEIVDGRLIARVASADDTLELSNVLTMLRKTAEPNVEVTTEVILEQLNDMQKFGASGEIDVTDLLPAETARALDLYARYLRRVGLFAKNIAAPDSTGNLGEIWNEDFHNYLGDVEPDDAKRMKSIWRSVCHQFAAVVVGESSADVLINSSVIEEKYKSSINGLGPYQDVTDMNHQPGDIVVFKANQGSQTGEMVHSAVLIGNQEVIEKRNPRDAVSTRNISQISDAYKDYGVSVHYLRKTRSR